jgi:hypothetical protein
MTVFSFSSMSLRGSVFFVTEAIPQGSIQPSFTAGDGVALLPVKKMVEFFFYAELPSKGFLGSRSQ